MIQRGEKHSTLSPAEEDFLLNDSNEVAKDIKKDSNKSKPSKTTTRSTSKSTTHASTGSGKNVNKAHDKGKQNEQSTSKDSNNNEQMMDMLKQIMNEQNKTNAQVKIMNKRIDDLYEEPEGYDQDDLDYDEYEEVDEVHDNADNEDQVEQEGPSASKKQKIDDTRFSSLNKRFRSGEKCDLPVNDNLAQTVTDIFRNGISEERYREMLKDEKMARPENCEGLVTVHTNQVIWDGLNPVTRTNDNKLKNLQTIIVKGSSVLTKVINKLDNICEKNNVEGLSQTIDDAMDALAFFGHANHELCLTRRELMKPDADEQYAHLFNKSVSFDKMLFGQDVSKTVTDINLCNRITRKIKRGGYRPWWRSRGRGRGRGGRGTGRGRSSGSSRGATKSTNSKNSDRWSANNYR